MSGYRCTKTFGTLVSMIRRKKNSVNFKFDHITLCDTLTNLDLTPQEIINMASKVGIAHPDSYMSK